MLERLRVISNRLLPQLPQRPNCLAAPIASHGILLTRSQLLSSGRIDSQLLLSFVVQG